MSSSSQLTPPAAQGQPELKRWQRLLLLFSVAVCAACGLVYELALVSLSTSLNGGSIVEVSLIVAGFVASLGLGAMFAKFLLNWPAFSFLLVEAVLGLVGGLSSTVLYVVFAVIGQQIVVLVVATLFIGILVGAELPLLMTLIQRGRTVDAKASGSIVATLNVADYAGGLLGGLAWPFLLLPLLGLMRGTAAAGILNVAAALAITMFVLRQDLRRAQFLSVLVALLLSAVVLATVVVQSSGIVATARQRLYRDPVVYAQQSDYQDIVVTQRKNDRRLFLNGGLQYSTRDEYRYTESLVYPALSDTTSSALIIGGGDGLAARELLRMPAINRITQVELDPLMVEVANTVLGEDNHGSLEDPRVRVLEEDAFSWIRHGGDGVRYDAVIVDLTDPDTDTVARLYSAEFYALLRKVLTPQGKMVVQSGSAFSTPDLFNRIRSTLLEAGCPKVRPYHVYVPTFGDWGFNLCAVSEGQMQLPRMRPELKYLNEDTFAAAAVFPPDNPIRLLEPSTLDHPRVVEDLRRGYR